jgi:hypothetical protein
MFWRMQANLPLPAPRRHQKLDGARTLWQCSLTNALRHEPNSMTTYIHIGLQKTGTTFLQRAMNLSRDELGSNGVVYPDPALDLNASKSSHGHHFLAQALLGKRTKFTPNADFSLLPKHVAAIKGAIGARPDAVGVISSEVFSTLRPPAIKRLRELFPEDDVRILIYLRRQDAWIDSLYGQMVKVGRKSSIEAFIKDEQARLDYNAVLRPWATAFGDERIVVRTYENLQGSELWDDFMEAVGAPHAKDVKPKLDSANDSLPPELTIFARSLNGYGKRLPLRRLLEQLATHFPAERGLKYLHAAEAAELMEGVAASNRAVAKRFLGRNRLFMDTDPLPFVGHDELSAEQYATILGGVCMLLLERIDQLESKRKASGVGSRMKKFLP